MRFQIIYSDDEKEDVIKFADVMTKYFPDHKMKPGRKRANSNHLYFDGKKKTK